MAGRCVRLGQAATTPKSGQTPTANRLQGRASPGAHRQRVRKNRRLGAVRRLAGKDRCRRLTAFDTETTSLDPMAANLVGMSFSVTPARRPICRWPIACADARGAVAAGRGAGEAQGLARSADHHQVGQNLSTTPTCWPTTVSACAALPTPTRILRAGDRQERTTWIRWPPPSRPQDQPTYTEVCGKAPSRSASPRWRSSGPSSTPPRMPTSPCACTSTCPASSPPEPRLEKALSRNRGCRCWRCCSRWSAPAC